MKRTETLKTWYLEICSLASLRPSRREVEGLTITQALVPSPELNRYLYTAIGGDWYWVDRLSWTWAQWEHYLAEPDVETWLAQLHGMPVGYVELRRCAEGDVKVEYLGVLSRLAGRGIGGRLLTFAIERGFALGTRRVWLHTCSLDHPRALEAYRARGLEVFRETEEVMNILAKTPGPWPGAAKPS